jgi:hypothetical protein
VVEPSQSGPRHDRYELQLGLLDFRQDVAMDWLPLWASQFRHVPTGYSWALPVVEPQPRSWYLRNVGTSTFHITWECWVEVSVWPGTLIQIYKYTNCNDNVSLGSLVAAVVSAAPAPPSDGSGTDVWCNGTDVWCNWMSTSPKVSAVPQWLLDACSTWCIAPRNIDK